MMRAPKILLAAIACIAAPALAEETPPALSAVVTQALPVPRLATVFEVKLRLPQGQGLARQLLDTGVASEDAAEAARLAAGHCDPVDGCEAKVALSRQLDSHLRVERVVLIDAVTQTVIERRNGRLALNPAAVSANKAAALI